MCNTLTGIMIKSSICKWFNKKEVRIEDILTKIGKPLDNIAAEPLERHIGLWEMIFIVSSIFGLFVVNVLLDKGVLVSNWWFLASPLFGLIAIAIYSLIVLPLLYLCVYFAFKYQILGKVFGCVLNTLIALGDACNFIGRKVLHVKVLECNSNKKRVK
jgi:hypothetical protein